jgi:hypothetical protein
MFRSIPGALRAAGLTMAVLLAAGHGLQADDGFTVTYNYGEPYVTVGYTNPASPTAVITGQATAAIPFAVTDNTTGSQFTAFCVDLYHDQYSPATYSAPTYSLAAPANASLLSNAFPYTAYTTDLANRLNYLGYVYNTLVATSTDSFLTGAVQLVLWTAIDSRFTYTATTGSTAGNTNLVTDTTILVDLLNGSGKPNESYTFGLSTGSTVNVSLSAYSAGTNYSYENGKLVVVHTTPQDTSHEGVNQNLISWGPSNNINIQSITPEPSSFALAGLGALAFIGYALRRRSKA